MEKTVYAPISVEEIRKHIIGKVRYDNTGQHFWDEENNMIAELRGWGRIQNLFKLTGGKIDFDVAGKFQDDVGEFIAAAINERLEKSTSTVQAITPNSIKKLLIANLSLNHVGYSVTIVGMDEAAKEIAALFQAPPLSNKEDIEKMSEEYEYGKDDMREGIAAGWIDGNKRGWDMSTDWPEHGYDFADKYLKNKA